VRRAVLAGIAAAYPGCPLRNSANDARDLGSFLVSRAGFDDVALLLEGEATQEAGFRAWQRAAQEAKPGDDLVLGFSGHGTEVSRTHTSDGMPGVVRQAICWVDYAQHWFDPFDDGMLKLALSSLAQGARLTIVLDCCHAAGLRAIFANPARARSIEAPAELRPSVGPLDRFGVKQTADYEVDATMRHLLYAACQPHQTASDGDGDNGAFTAALLGQLADNPATTNLQIAEGVQERLSSGGYGQNPELIGPAEFINAYFSGGWR
jgi:hypothetical protein